MANHLVISAIGPDREGTVEMLSKAIVEAGCNIEDSRMAVLSGTFAIIQLVSGRWDSLAKLESALKPLQQKFDLILNTRRTEAREAVQPSLPYTIDVVAMDRPGLVRMLASFLAGRGINIQEMMTRTYPAAHTGTSMFSIHMTIAVPAQLPLAHLREEFLDLCDAENLDGVIEPVKF